jgi:hypothetical protein
VEQLLTPGSATVMPGTVSADQIPFSGKSAASWPAIIAGAFVATAATLILIALGSGIGLASISPWSGRGVSVTTFAITGAIWLILTQWISAALGGYIAGRLRTRWVGTHTHEVFFRDTAHGLITWSVATLLVAAVLSSSITSGAGAAGRAATEVASAGLASAGVQGAMHNPGPQAPGTPVSAYSIDKLFRPAAGTPTGAGPGASPNSGAPGGPPGAGSADPRMETGHIIGNALISGSVPDADRAYLVDQVSARTGISQADAQTRVDAFIASAMQAEAKVKADADSARKATAQASIYLALSMLVGAFIASVAAALGGRLRDEHL